MNNAEISPEVNAEVEEEDVIEKSLEKVQGLQKIEIEDLYHPNNELKEKLKRIGASVFLLKNTIYGFFMKSSDAENCEFMWFGFHKGIGEFEGKIIPDSDYSFETILDLCGGEEITGLLYHLDIFVKNNNKTT